jgi:hypothetical protein
MPDWLGDSERRRHATRALTRIPRVDAMKRPGRMRSLLLELQGPSDSAGVGSHAGRDQRHVAAFGHRVALVVDAVVVGSRGRPSVWS